LSLEAYIIRLKVLIRTGERYPIFLTCHPCIRVWNPGSRRKNSTFMWTTRPWPNAGRDFSAGPRY